MREKILALVLALVLALAASGINPLLGDARGGRHPDGSRGSGINPLLGDARGELMGNLLNRVFVSIPY